VSAGTIAAYREQFADFSGNGGGAGPSWLPGMRRHAFDQFANLGFPTTRDEDYHYTSVAPIAETSFRIVPGAPAAISAQAIRPYVIDDSWSRLVFVNGQFSREHSVFADIPAEVEISTLRELLVDDPGFLESRLASLAETATNAFAALNTAFVTDGVVIRVPADCVVDNPIHVLWIATDAAAGMAVFPRLLVDVGTHGRLAMVESFVGIGEGAYFTDAVTELRLGDGAHLEHYKLQREATDALHVSTAQATQGRDSVLHAFSFATGARLSRTNVYTVLAAPGGEARLNGLYLLDGNQHCDHQTYVHHAAEQCASRELYKGILDDASHGVFNGKVLVDAIAQKTDGKQTNHALLLSDHAKIDTKPQLEIFADDVKCTHGATVGRLDDTMLFYLKSRGINADTARALLTYAFAAEAIATIEIPALRDSLQSLAFERYNDQPLR
jgi:Fe-S cluster assembly protein SufD